MFENEKFAIVKMSGRIFKLRLFAGVELDVEDIRKMRDVYLTLSKGEKFAVLLSATEAFSITEEARSILASKEYTDTRFAAAFVTKSLANKLIGNFFIKINKPASPTRLFSDEAPALAWLKEQEEENK